MSRDERRSAPTPPDLVAILAALTAHRPDFVVVGGVAVAHHGFLRATKDLDIVPKPSPPNLIDISALREAHGDTGP